MALQLHLFLSASVLPLIAAVDWGGVGWGVLQSQWQICGPMAPPAQASSLTGQYLFQHPRC
jgi:hypothetical protein